MSHPVSEFSFYFIFIFSHIQMVFYQELIGIHTYIYMRIHANHPPVWHMLCACASLQFNCCRSYFKSIQLYMYEYACIVCSRCVVGVFTTKRAPTVAHPARSAVDRMFSWLHGLCKLTAEVWPTKVQWYIAGKIQFLRNYKGPSI